MMLMLLKDTCPNSLLFTENSSKNPGNPREFMPESPRMFMLLGLNLLRLLAQTRISEFHTELEAIGSHNLKNVYINHPVSIEQALMEGSYNKVMVWIRIFINYF
jgi:CSN8/PSMD8/EIF3K family